jgi:hypothetical protein
MTEAEIKAIVDKVADIAAVLAEADPDDKAEMFRQLALKLPTIGQTASPSSDRGNPGIGKSMVSEGGLEHANRGYIPGSGIFTQRR